MADDPDEIYSAPSESEVKSSFANIRKAFEAKQQMPIKVATDGRHKSKAAETVGQQSNRTKMSFKPKPGQGPPIIQGKPILPLKKVPKGSDGGPPQLPDKTSPLPDKSSPTPDKSSPTSPMSRSNGSIHRPGNRASRESIFPPEKDPISPPDKKAPKTLPKQVNGVVSPELPERGATPPVSPQQRQLPQQPDASIVKNTRGSFKPRPVPPTGSGPPAKPAKMSPASVQLPSGSGPPPPKAKTVIEVGSSEGVEPEEIYDDVTTPLPPSSPPPGPELLRPVSMIPEMTEDDEFSDDEKRPPPSKALPPVPAQVHHDDDQEVYDDVGDGDPPDKDDGEEIYEDI